MKRIILAAVLAAFAVPALAQVNVGSGTQANSDALAKSQQHQGLTNAPVMINEASEIPTNTEQKIRNTPGLALGGPASGPCNGFSAGVGLSLPGFGLAGNMSKVDEGCEERETARIAALMGRMDIANMVLEEMDVVIRAKARRDARTAKPATQPARTSAIPAQPQLVAASSQITPSEQARAVCDNARLTGDTIIATRLNCPK